jgi:hypothetical protein
MATDASVKAVTDILKLWLNERLPIQSTTMLDVEVGHIAETIANAVIAAEDQPVAEAEEPKSKAKAKS